MQSVVKSGVVGRRSGQETNMANGLSVLHVFLAAERRAQARRLSRRKRLAHRPIRKSKETRPTSTNGPSVLAHFRKVETRCFRLGSTTIVNTTLLAPRAQAHGKSQCVWRSKPKTGLKTTELIFRSSESLRLKLFNYCQPTNSNAD